MKVPLALPNPKFSLSLLSKLFLSGTPDSPEAEDSLVRPRAVSAANQQGLITWADVDFYRPAATEAPPAAMSPPSPARKLSISEPPPTTAPQMPPTKPKVHHTQHINTHTHTHTLNTLNRL